MADVKQTILDNIARAHQAVPVEPRRPASNAVPLGIVDLTDGSPQPIHRLDASTFDPRNRADAVHVGLRAARTYNGASRGELNSATSPLGAPSVGGRVLPI